ncbi:hypothetical protein AAFC00_001024 [Neodothiora populina]|uniref:Transcriptional coactivator p15 (PC4) C-terminal domain-containing protein n=1 Tax=Neodothiora populina TaxID=2781224 RepID=A0ABR3PMX4_9PEZI
MAPKYKSRKRVSEVEEYGSDDGFVEDAPKSKKPKVTKAAPSKDLQKDAEGNEYWELSAKRRVTLSTYNNAHLVNIREYYEKDGKSLPGKKGISLSVEQFNAIIELLPQLEACLKDKGEDIARPDYGAAPSAVVDAPSSANVENEAEGSHEGGTASDPPKPAGKLEEFKYSKKNHEATSDEEE